MSKRKYDFIVFDWDGTLMDSTTTIIKCIQAAARDLGLTVPSDENVSYVIGLGMSDAMKTAMPDVDPQLYPKIIERYRQHYFNQDNDLVLFNGVREMLNDLSQQGYFLAVATGKSRVGLNRALNASKLMTVFDATRCADETFPKPHPAMLFELTRELGQDMNRTVMIGDTTHDILMAGSAGADAIGVNYGAHENHLLRELNPVYIANNVPLLHQWLNENA